VRLAAVWGDVSVKTAEESDAQDRSFAVVMARCYGRKAAGALLNWPPTWTDSCNSFGTFCWVALLLCPPFESEFTRKYSRIPAFGRWCWGYTWAAEGQRSGVEMVDDRMDEQGNAVAYVARRLTGDSDAEFGGTVWLSENRYMDKQ
jgi:hypothetical protein